MIGLLGDIRFRVSDKRVLTIRNLNGKSALHGIQWTELA